MLKKTEPAEDFYRLKTKAVDDLVHANEENSPQVPEEELNRYRSSSNIRVANWLKAVFIKFWFSGAVCFFFIWGLGTYFANALDIMVIAAVATGFVMDILENNLFRFYAKTEGENDKWMMVTCRGFKSLILNVVYSAVIMFCVYLCYAAINIVVLKISNGEKFLGVEPLLFGILYMGCDMLLIGVKHLFVRIVSDAKENENRRV